MVGLFGMVADHIVRLWLRNLNDHHLQKIAEYQGYYELKPAARWFPRLSKRRSRASAVSST
jgi:hypothetical protein